MTLSELCLMDGKSIANFTDKELLEFFEKEGYLNVTRPERAVKPQEQKQVMKLDPVKQQKLLQLKEMGVDIGAFLKHNNRKKK